MGEVCASVPSTSRTAAAVEAATEEAAAVETATVETAAETVETVETDTAVVETRAATAEAEEEGVANPKPAARRWSFRRSSCPLAHRSSWQPAWPWRLRRAETPWRR